VRRATGQRWMVTCGGLVRCAVPIPVLFLLPPATRFPVNRATSIDSFVSVGLAAGESSGSGLIICFRVTRPLNQWIFRPVDTPCRAHSKFFHRTTLHWSDEPSLSTSFFLFPSSRSWRSSFFPAVTGNDHVLTQTESRALHDSLRSRPIQEVVCRSC
jgi:hypothetical protein